MPRDHRKLPETRIESGNFSVIVDGVTVVSEGKKTRVACKTVPVLRCTRNPKLIEKTYSYCGTLVHSVDDDTTRLGSDRQCDSKCSSGTNVRGQRNDLEFGKGLLHNTREIVRREAESMSETLPNSPYLHVADVILLGPAPKEFFLQTETAKSSEKNYTHATNT